MSAASRRRRTRWRSKLGLVSLRVDVHENDLAECLVRSLRLSPAQTLDKSLVEREVTRIVLDFCARLGVSTRDWTLPDPDPYSHDP
jgi:hypothetical protein